MNPTRVWARSFRTYESVEWTIPSGLTAIVGRNTVTDGSDSNGSGKSSLLELLPIALFGPPMPWSEYLTAGGDAETCEVGCELEHAGVRYRLRRTFSAKGRGSSKLDFEQLIEVELSVEGGWAPLTRGTQQDTQDAISQTLHLSESVFSHSVYAAQGARHFADPSLPPRERKQIMAEALGLDAWDAKLELVRADLSETKGEIAGIEVRLGTFADDIATLPRLYQERSELFENARGAADLLQTAEAMLADAAAGYAARKAETARYEAATIAVRLARTAEEQLRAELAAGRQAAEEGKSLAESLPALLDLSSRVDTLAAEVAAREHAAEARASALREQAALTKGQATLREQAKELMDEEAEHTARADQLVAEMDVLKSRGSGVCAHCNQPIQGDALVSSLASTEHDVAALRTRAKERAAALAGTIAEGQAVTQALADIVIPPDTALPAGLPDETEMALAEARKAERDLATTEERIRHIGLQVDRAATEFVSRHAEAVTALAAAEAELRDAEPEATGLDWQATHDTAVQHAAFARTGDHQAREDLAKADERIRNLEELRDRSQEAVLAKGLLGGRLDHLRQMEVAYGRNGIPALLMEAHAIPQVEREASRVLEQLGVPFRIELVTQAEKKSGGLKDTLDVVVHGPGGPLRFESYSGGEQTRLAFALRVAFARLIAGQRGSEIGVLFLDELQFLDGAGLAAVAEVLKGLSEFRSVVLVSHDERLVDSFDSVITVVRDESGSRLEEAA